MMIKPTINQNGLAIWRATRIPGCAPVYIIPSWPNAAETFFFILLRRNGRTEKKERTRARTHARTRYATIIRRRRRRPVFLRNVVSSYRAARIRSRCCVPFIPGTGSVRFRSSTNVSAARFVYISNTVIHPVRSFVSRNVFTVRRTLYPVSGPRNGEGASDFTRPRRYTVSAGVRRRCSLPPPSSLYRTYREL